MLTPDWTAYVTAYTRRYVIGILHAFYFFIQRYLENFSWFLNGDGRN